MLMRTQVLFEDWQVEYIKDIAERYDLSFSEITRLLSSLGMIISISTFNPEIKIKIPKEPFIKFSKEDSSAEERHQILSRLYFEARKAVEYRLSKVGKKKK